MKSNPIDIKKTGDAKQQIKLPAWYEQMTEELSDLVRSVASAPGLSKEEWGKIERMLY